MNVKVYVQIVMIAVVMNIAQAIPEEKKSIKNFPNYNQFESYSYDFSRLYNILKKSNSLFGDWLHFTDHNTVLEKIDPRFNLTGLQDQFKSDFSDADRFPYEQWLTLGCVQVPMQDIQKKFEALCHIDKNLVDLNQRCLNLANATVDADARKFGSSYCERYQEIAQDAGSGIIEIIDSETEEVKRRFKDDGADSFMRIIYNPNGMELATQASNGTIKFWDLKSEACTHTIPASLRLKCMYANDGKEFAYSPNGLYWRVLRWDLFKKFERNDYTAEESVVIEKCLDKQKLTSQEKSLVYRLLLYVGEESDSEFDSKASDNESYDNKRNFCVYLLSWIKSKF